MIYDDGYPKDNLFDGKQGDAQRPVVFAILEKLFPIEVKEIAHDDVPDGAVCIASFLDGRMIARTRIRAERSKLFRSFFDEPRPLLYRATETDDGSVEGTLCALLPYDMVRRCIEKAELEEEPWKASVPNVESDWKGETPDPQVPEDTMVPMPIGVVVRLAAKREHPANLAIEAASILQRVVEGQVVEIVDQLIDSL